MDPPNPQESYHFIGRGGGQPCPTCLDPLFLQGCAESLGLLFGFPWALPPLGIPNSNQNLMKRQACINPTAGHAAPAQPPNQTPFFSSAQVAQITKDRYKAQVPPAEPVMPTWRNMPMVSKMANLPLARSADQFLVFSAGTLEARTLKPKSPAAALVPAEPSSVRPKA